MFKMPSSCIDNPKQNKADPKLWPHELPGALSETDPEKGNSTGLSLVFCLPGLPHHTQEYQGFWAEVS